MRTNRPKNDEGGFTLIELLVAATMMVIITGAAVTMLTSIMNREPKVSKQASRIGMARNAFEKMSGDLREGVELTVASPSMVTVNTLCGATGGTDECSVTYTCGEEAGQGTYECRREVPGVSTAQVISDLASPDVFCFYPNDQNAECGESGANEDPTYVGMKLQFPLEHNETTNSTLEAGVALHNAPTLLNGSGVAPEAGVE